MQNNKTFTITFTKQNGESTTRHAKWTDKTGKSICTYWDIEGDGFRNATVSWTMKGDK